MAGLNVRSKILEEGSGDYHFDFALIHMTTKDSLKRTVLLICFLDCWLFRPCHWAAQEKLKHIFFVYNDGDF